MQTSGRILLLALLLLLSVSCNKKQPLNKSKISVTTAQLISEAPLNLINSTGEVRIRFNQDLADESQTGQLLKDDILRFEPQIKGQVRWQDKNTLTFKPDHPWQQRRQYRGTLDLARLLPESGKNLTPFHFTFSVAGREVQNFKADFTPVEADNPQKLLYKGTLTFTEAAEPRLVKESVVFTVDGKGIPLKWAVSTDQKRYSFSSAALRRSARARSGRFLVQPETLNLSAAFSRQVTIPPLQDLTISNVFVQSSATQPALKIKFSDRLVPGQDLRGLISVKPQLPLKLKILGAEVLVQAPFEHGQKYTIRVQPGVRSRFGSKTKRVLSEEITFEDMAPDMRFSNDGVFLSSGNNKKIMFQTVNLKQVHLQIIKVFATNLGQFLQMERLNGARQRRNNFGYEVDRVGLPVAEMDLAIGQARNRWLQHQLDLGKLIDKDAKGLYLLKISFTREDMLYDTSQKNLRYRQRYDYYYDPAGYGYIYNHGRIFKPIIVSDIGITYKQSGKEHLVFCSNLITTQPMSGVSVRLRSYQNQILAEGRSDKNGLARFGETEQKVFFAEAEKGDQRSVVKVNEMGWTLSTFDTKGAKPPAGGVQAYIYTERGVYRPGDTVNVSVILRNERHTFPDHHPVQFSVKNPRHQVVYSGASSAGRDGFYIFRFYTQPQDITGNYQAEITAGSQKFYQTIKIETIAPERLKVQLIPRHFHLGPTRRFLNIKVHSEYLFGQPAAGLQAQAEAVYFLDPLKFRRFTGFSFTNQTKRFDYISQDLFSGRLNAGGDALIQKKLPDFSGAPGRLKANVNVSVLEKGGRAVRRSALLTIDPYDYYVGLKAPKMRYGSVRTGSEVQIPLVLVDSTGSPRPGRTLRYRIYRNERHWWWEYESNNEYRLRFKQDRSTKNVLQGTIVSGAQAVFIKFTPQERGQYLVEVQDTDRRGHSATIFFYASAWGEGASGKNAGILALRSDKETYTPGEEAHILFPAPAEAAILFTLEQGQRVLDYKWLKPQKGQKEQRIAVTITKEMAPNVYASVSVIQPQSHKSNDRPMRMYGVVPLRVEDPQTRQDILLTTPAVLKPGQTFSVNIQTRDHKAAQFTVAVVDEGLLSLTRFSSPDPWKAFFKKQRLEILTSDLFSQVIGVNRGDIFRTFSIGGGMEEASYRQQQLAQHRARRFKPVCLFKGPLFTDAQGKAEVPFTMPQYVGAVRIMVVAANHNRYGSAQKSVPVRKDLMLLPTLPRFLAPGDEILLPVTVFATDKIKQATVDLKLSGPLQAVGHARRELTFTKAGQKDIYFRLKAKRAVGTANIELRAKSPAESARYQTELAVRSASPRLRASESKAIQPGEQLTLPLPNRGLPGSNRAVVSVHRRPKLNLDRRIYWLIQYPYGCIEQTVSAVFPQLYLQEFIPKSRVAARDIDEDINEGITRLRKFRLKSGAFSYWPGQSEVSEWGALYAGHFLTEARQAGYHVPDDLYDGWLEYTRRQARLGEGKLMSRVYRIYLLALAGQPSFSAMNLLKENKLAKMTDVQRWLLAGAYQLAGAAQSAAFILKKTAKKVADYQETGGTFGSALRDQAIILEMLRLFKRWEEADLMAGVLTDALSGEGWYSTQTSGFMLLALGKYFRALEGTSGQQKRLAGKILLPNGKHISFDTQKIAFSRAITSGFGQSVTVKLSSASAVKRAFVTVDWSGLPLEYSGQNFEQNLKLKVSWLDEDGLPLDVSSLKQGAAFWAHFSVSRPAVRNNLNELALAQLLPAGWEIDHNLLSEEQRPPWMSKLNLGNEEYRDLRDDRAMWFFNLPAYSKKIDFMLRLTAVTAGRFSLPPTIAEAMYNNRYHAEVEGQRVRVTERK